MQGLFILMEQRRFPVAGVAPIVCFGWSDEASMAADNSSAFNYRLIAGTDQLSQHALDQAVDINLRENPEPSRKTILWSGPSGRRAGAGAGILPISGIITILKRPKSGPSRSRCRRMFESSDHLLSFTNSSSQYRFSSASFPLVGTPSPGSQPIAS